MVKKICYIVLLLIAILVLTPIIHAGIEETIEETNPEEEEVPEEDPPHPRSDYPYSPSDECNLERDSSSKNDDEMCKNFLPTFREPNANTLGKWGESLCAPIAASTAIEKLKKCCGVPFADPQPMEGIAKEIAKSAGSTKENGTDHDKFVVAVNDYLLSYSFTCNMKLRGTFCGDSMLSYDHEGISKNRCPTKEEINFAAKNGEIVMIFIYNHWLTLGEIDSDGGYIVGSNYRKKEYTPVEFSSPGWDNGFYVKGEGDINKVLALLIIDTGNCKEKCKNKSRIDPSQSIDEEKNDTDSNKVSDENNLASTIAPEFPFGTVMLALSISIIGLLFVRRRD